MERTNVSPTRSIAPSDGGSISSGLTSSQSSDKRSGKTIAEAQSAMLPLIEEAINETIAEKRARGKEISELLCQLDMSPKSMPKDIQDLWTKAAAIMRFEGLSSIDENTLTLHMLRNKKEAMKKIIDERKLKDRFNNLQASQTVVLEKNNRAQESVNSLLQIVEDAPNNNELHVNRMVNAVKLNDYNDVIDKTEESLKRLGANNYFPENILNKYNTYLELREELQEVEQSLSRYHDLPPNLSEARVKLAEKEKYYKDLEDAIFEKMK